MSQPARLISNLHPGVNVITQYEPTTRYFDTAKPNRIFAIITSEKGPLNQAESITSYQQYIQTFGGYVDGSYGLAMADVIFNGWGGQTGYNKPEIVVVSVKGPGAAKASRTVQDASSVNTLEFRAKNEGTWGHKIKVKIERMSLTQNVEAPLSAPTLSKAAEGGTIAADTYEIKYVYNNANGNTTASEAASITTTGATSTITVTAATELPYGASTIKAYVKVSGNYRLAGTGADGAKTVTFTAIPAGGTDQLPSSNTATVPYLKLSIWYNNTLVQVYDKFEFTENAIEWINSQQMYVDLIDKNSATAIPGNLPATMSTALPLFGGVDDFENVDNDVIIGDIGDDGSRTGLQIFRDDTLGSGVMIAPGYTDDTVLQELDSIATDYYRIALLDQPVDSTLTEIKTWADTGAIDSTHSAVVVPWRAWWNPQASETRTSERIWIPSSIDMAGAAHWSSIVKGPYRAWAGREYKLPKCPPANKTTNTIGGLYKNAYGGDLVQDEQICGEMADNYGITSCISLRKTGPVIYHCVLKTTSTLIRFIPEAVVRNVIYYKMQDAFDYSGLVFSSLSAIGMDDFFQSCRELATLVMKGIFNEGGLAAVSGSQLSGNFNDGCRIVCNSDNNPIDRLQQGIVQLDVYWYNVPIAIKIAINLHPRNLTDKLE